MGIAMFVYKYDINIKLLDSWEETGTYRFSTLD
jgi:hypothetical protein